MPLNSELKVAAMYCNDIVANSLNIPAKKIIVIKIIVTNIIISFVSFKLRNFKILPNKKSSFDIPKIKDSEFMATNISNKLKADNVRFAQSVFRKEDPNELFIAINELAWNITQTTRNATDAYYWLEWILGYEKIMNKNKKKIFAASRNYEVENKYKTDNKHL